MIITLFLLITVLNAVYLIYKVFSLYYKFKKLNQYGVKTKGTITDYDIVKGKNNDTYYPIVKFRTYSGIEIHQKSIQGFDKKEYENAPDEVEVIYLDSNPKEFIVEGQKFKNMAFFLLVASIGMTIFGYHFLIESNPDWINDTIEYFKNL